MKKETLRTLEDVEKEMEKRNFLYQYGLFGWNYAYLLLHPWVVFRESCYRAKWFIQRGNRGYSDRDLWGLDTYLTSWMPEALTTLKRTKHGYPCDLTPGKWAKTLEGMIVGFKAAKRLQEMDFEVNDRKTPKLLRRQTEKGLTLFRDHFFDLWD